MNTTDSHAPQTNGVAPVAIAYTDYPVRSTAVIGSGKTASVPYRLRRAATIVDVIGDPDVEIVGAAFGRRRIDLRPQPGQEQKSMHAVLDAEPCEASGGTFCALTIRNTSDKAREIALILRVTNEHGPEVESGSPFRMIGDPSVLGAAGAKRPTIPKPKQPQAPANTARAARTDQGAQRSTGVRRPPPGTSDKERAKERAKRARSSAVDPVITVAPVVQPPPTSKVLTLFRSYASALASFFAFKAPLRRQLRPAILNALTKAHARPVGASVRLVSGEIAIVLSEADMKRFYDTIRLHREYQVSPSDAQVLRDAIQKALAGSPDSVTVEEIRPTGRDPAQNLAALVHVDEENSENKHEDVNEVEAMLANDLSNTSTPSGGPSE